MSGPATAARARHLYVHLPFCAHRCGYCDFVTVVGRRAEHGRYVDALLAELALERAALAPRLETIFPGGVCDWSKPGVGQEEAVRTWQRYDGATPVSSR